VDELGEGEELDGEKTVVSFQAPAEWTGDPVAADPEAVAVAEPAAVVEPVVADDEPIQAMPADSAAEEAPTPVMAGASPDEDGK
jgi:hypothetical protein